VHADTSSHAKRHAPRTSSSSTIPAEIRARLTEMLAGIGNVDVVGEAESSRQAIDGILETRPDSVLLDLNLGTSNGIEVLRVVPGQRRRKSSFNRADQPIRSCNTASRASGPVRATFLDKSSEFERVREVIAEIASTRH
jgi:DNA-binding NarL/FixJ family response regulator